MKFFANDHLEEAHVSRFDKVGNDIYVGVAEMTVQGDMARWSIKKINTTNPISIKWAGWTASFDKVWDSREMYLYL